MKNLLRIAVLMYLGHTSMAQNVTTYAGKANDDPETNYESASGKGLKDSYFSNPMGLCFDPNGTMYISEKNKVRIVVNNQLHIRSGSLQQPTFSEGYKNGTGTQSTFRNPSGMAADAQGNIYIADKDNHCIRKLARFVNLGNGQVVSTFAGADPTTGLPGNGSAGASDGTGSASRFKQPIDVAIDENGNLYVTDLGNYTIRKITPAGVVTTLAGTANIQGSSDGTGASANFGRPWGVAVYTDNTIVVSDPWNGNIRKINIFSGATTTLAGSTSGPDPRSVDGTLAQSRFKAPKGIAVVDGIIYVADQNVIRAINEENNSVTTFAGNISEFAIKDGLGSSASFTEIDDLASDGAGNLYATENSLAVSSHIIRKITIDSLAPTANFEATKRSLIVTEVVTLTDISTGQQATDRSWAISPSNFAIIEGDLTSEILKIAFNQTGFYQVRLTVTNGYGSDTKTSENYFAVSTTGSVASYSNSPLINIYPNPANQIIHIAVDASLSLNNGKMELYTITGEKIRELKPADTIDVGQLSNGTYFITFTSDQHHIVKRVVISHK